MVTLKKKFAGFLIERSACEEFGVRSGLLEGHVVHDFSIQGANDLVAPDFDLEINPVVLLQIKQLGESGALGRPAHRCQPYFLRRQMAGNAVSAPKPPG